MQLLLTGSHALRKAGVVKEIFSLDLFCDHRSLAIALILIAPPAYKNTFFLVRLQRCFLMARSLAAARLLDLSVAMHIRDAEAIP